MRKGDEWPKGAGGMGDKERDGGTQSGGDGKEVSVEQDVRSTRDEEAKGEGREEGRDDEAHCPDVELCGSMDVRDVALLYGGGTDLACLQVEWEHVRYDV